MAKCGKRNVCIWCWQERLPSAFRTLCTHRIYWRWTAQNVDAVSSCNWRPGLC